VGGFAGKILERMGVVAQNIPAGEIYQSLEKGTIDAAEWISPYDDQKLGLNKVAPFYYYPGWWEGGPQLTLMVNQKAYDALSPENKAIIEAASSLAHIDIQAKYDAFNPGALKQLAAQKTKVLPFPKEMMDVAFKHSQDVYAELNAKNPNWKKSTKTTPSSVPIRTGGSASVKPVSTASCRHKSSDRCRSLQQPAARKPGGFCFSGALLVLLQRFGQAGEFVQQGTVVAVEEGEGAAQVAHINAGCNEELQSPDAHHFDEGQLLEHHAPAPHPGLLDGVRGEQNPTALDVKNHESEHGPDHGAQGALT